MLTFKFTGKQILDTVSKIKHETIEKISKLEEKNKRLKELESQYMNTTMAEDSYKRRVALFVFLEEKLLKDATYDLTLDQCIGFGLVQGFDYAAGTIYC